MKRRWLLLAITVAALVGVAAPMVAYADKGRGNQKLDRVSRGMNDDLLFSIDGRVPTGERWRHRAHVTFSDLDSEFISIFDPDNFFRANQNVGPSTVTSVGDE